MHGAWKELYIYKGSGPHGTILVSCHKGLSLVPLQTSMSMFSSTMNLNKRGVACKVMRYVP